SALHCRVVQSVPAGDHQVLISEVLETVPLQSRPPLIYFDRGYHRLHETLGSSINPDENV
ncbi:MAG: flavin reductase family protein, partial [Firmicutes bacterium]|nr:flavin reductase family protein [Bacillota bacterium]